MAAVNTYAMNMPGKSERQLVLHGCFIVCVCVTSTKDPQKKIILFHTLIWNWYRFIHHFFSIKTIHFFLFIDNIRR